jgi:hypothetical protein
MKWASCDCCGKEFRRKKSQLKLAVKHYCSIACAEQGRRKGKMVECFGCKELVYKSLKDLKRSVSKKYFCSKACANIWLGIQQRAENSPNWAGGKSSYKNMLKRTDIKKSCILCKRNDSRFLCVHHIDKNRENNRIKNLVWLCRNCHFLIHNYRNEMYQFLEKIKNDRC